ncbi:shikimate dehydrogenase family protein [Dinghuibacter silviterrae]|uniref:Shikimate dehydrogenase n=1 Tax=Dinghuibacter silviterrae TaxID=1539049 RepID=A0A4V3GLS4_9BACT|nr:shikimate dehydrogenase [Dinghuibacter silviterrae]TDX00663.1 shikimate dehydrogenase [Dinghuibacter silviterrae]
MRLFGLIGYPLGHSFSKKYFTQKFQDEGITDCRYELFPIPVITDLPGLLASQPDLCGLNVTIPYKEQVLPYLFDPGQAALVGACNCIVVRDGRLYGYNTDVAGFRESFRPGLRPFDRHALILGTGGASKAAAFALAELGIGYRHVSRSGAVGAGAAVGGASAATPGGPFGPEGPTLRYDEVTPALLETYTVLINCSPVGTFPHVDEAPALPYAALSARHYLFDLVYNPEKTRFLAEGEARGAVIRNGYDMLRIQAEEGWAIWNRER